MRFLTSAFNISLIAAACFGLTASFAQAQSISFQATFTASDLNGNVGAAGDINNDGVPDIIAAEDRSASDRVSILSGVDGSVLNTITGDPSGNFGFSVDGAGDVNGDGYGDVIVGAPANGSGSAFVYSGQDGSVLWSFSGDSDGDGFGGSVGKAGDLNQDGFGDVIVGASQFTQGSGYARVLSGFDGTELFTFFGTGTDSRNGFGRSVDGNADVNGDGINDLIVGAIQSNANGGTGIARIFDGSNGNELYSLTGDSSGDGFGESVAFAGDVNGDGRDDLLISAIFDGGEDIDRVPHGSVRVVDGLTGDEFYTLLSDGSEFLGGDLSGAADFDGDGFDDLLVGSSGVAYLFSGQDGSEIAQFSDGSVGFGSSVAVLGDLNLDGISDFVVRSRGAGATVFLSSVAVPEPNGVVALVCISVILILKRSRLA